MTAKALSPKVPLAESSVRPVFGTLRPLISSCFFGFVKSIKMKPIRYLSFSAESADQRLIFPSFLLHAEYMRLSFAFFCRPYNEMQAFPRIKYNFERSRLEGIILQIPAVLFFPVFFIPYTQKEKYAAGIFSMDIRHQLYGITVEPIEK